MSRTRPGAGGDSGYRVEAADDGRARLLLSGDWSNTGTPPAAEAVLQALERNAPQARHLEIDFSGVTRWAGALPAVVRRIEQHCAALDISCEAQQQPPALQQLLSLAGAVRAPQRAGESPAAWWSRQRTRAALHDIGEETLDSLAFLGAATAACARALLPGVPSLMRWRDLQLFVFQSGPGALPIITLTSVLVGMILAYLGAVQLAQFGAELYVADLVAIGMLREMGALMTAVVMAGRTGAAYAAQLGTMQVNEEIDAITTMGLSPMEFLVAPRMLALLLCMPVLTLYADLLGILGGALVAGGMGVSGLQYLSELHAVAGLEHFLVGIGKSVVFAALIGIAGCRAGLAAGRNSAAVGKATTEAVVTALVYLIVADAGLNILFQRIGL